MYQVFSMYDISAGGTTSPEAALSRSKNEVLMAGLAALTGLNVNEW